MRKAQNRRKPADNPCTTPTPTMTSEYTRMAWLLPGRIPLSMAPAARNGTAILAAVHENPASTPSTSQARWEPSVPRISRHPARRVSRSRSTSSPSTARAPRLAAPASAGCRSRLPAGFRGPRRDCETVGRVRTDRTPPLRHSRRHRATHDAPSADALGGVGKLGVRGLASVRPRPRRVQVVVNHPSRRGFDPRPLRFEQGVIALVLLIGFTFQFELLIPIVTAVLAVSGAVGPRRAPLPRLFSAVAGDRLDPPDAFVDR